MKHPIRILLVTAALLSVLTLGFDDAMAQRRGGPPSSSGQTPAPSLSVTYGSMWGGNIDILYGKIRAGTGASWGIALDVPVAYGTEVELTYTHQDGSLDWDHQGTTTLSDMSVDVYQIAGLRPLGMGRVTPFVLGGLGATHFSTSESSAMIGDEEVSLESSTRFSLLLGMGFRTYFGEAQRVGLRASFKVIPTFYNTNGGLWFGTGGASVGVSGSALWQWEVAGGLTVKFGS